MQYRRFCGLGVAALLLGLMNYPVRAESFDLISNDGPIRLHIDHAGDVYGEYPKLHGIIHGHVSADGTVEGMWLQPTSDHPCRRMHGETYSWGSFSISNLYRHNVRGSWGYCDEQPTRDWGIYHD